MSATWKNRIIGYAEVDPASLIPNDRNWRTHPHEQKQALAGVLEEIGVVQNIIVNKRSGRLVDGHLRLDLALKHGQPTIAVTYVDLSDEEEAAILATIDPLSALAGADHDKLGDLLGRFSFESDAVNEMLNNLYAGTGELEDELDTVGDPEPEAAPAQVEETAWPTVSVRVAPHTLQRYLDLQDQLNGDNESTKFTDLVSRAASTLGERS
jgi:ParB-like chromosome segregation protein Spo0J